MDREQHEALLRNFGDALRGVAPDRFADVSYDVFEDLFPPGVLDDGAKGAAYDFARARGFYIENRPDKLAVWFVKDDPAV